MKNFNRSCIGSVSKVITSIAALKAIEEKKLELQSKIYGSNGCLRAKKYMDAIKKGIDKYSPGSKDWMNHYKAMELIHLLTHTSGFSDGVDDGESYRNYEDYHIKTLETKRLESFTPGEGNKYSNHGMGLVGHIIHVVTGIEYRDYVKSRILRPLGIEDQVIPVKSEWNSMDAEVHTFENGKLKKKSYGIINNGLAAGGWTAAATHLVRIMLACDQLNNRRDIFDNAHNNLLDLMETEWFHSGHSVGWDISRNSSGTYIAKAGEGRCIATIARYLPGYQQGNVNIGGINIAVCSNILSSVESHGKSVYSLLVDLRREVTAIIGRENIPTTFDLY